MQPNNRQSFIDYCLRKLGEPVVRTNLAPEQIDDRIDEALHKFHERHYNGTEEQWFLVPIENLDVTNGYITLPDDVVSVANTFRVSGGGTTLFSPEYQFFQSEVYGYNNSMKNGDMAYLYMMRSHFSLVKQFLVPDFTFTFNGKTKRLKLAGGLENAQWQDGGIIVHAYKSLALENPNADPDIEVFANLWSEKWLQDYATEHLRMQWGQNLSKFGGVQLVGGVTIDGNTMKQEAQTNIDKLELQLQDEYEGPVMGCWG